MKLRSERGQAVLAVVLLLGLIVLAVYFGLMAANQRQMKAGADAIGNIAGNAIDDAAGQEQEDIDLAGRQRHSCILLGQQPAHPDQRSCHSPSWRRRRTRHQLLQRSRRILHPGKQEGKLVHPLPGRRWQNRPHYFLAAGSATNSIWNPPIPRGMGPGHGRRSGHSLKANGVQRKPHFRRTASCISMAFQPPMSHSTMIQLERKYMATHPIPIAVKQALGAALVEVLTGNLTDETIAAVRDIQKSDVPANLVDVLHAIQTMSTHPVVRESASRNVLGELSAAANDALQERMKS